MTLFERSTRGAFPTLHGRAFLESARRIVSDIDNLLTTARAVRQGEIGSLKIGYSSSLSAGHLRMALAEFMCRFPDVQLDGVAGGPDKLNRDLRSRAIDIALHAGAGDERGVRRQSLWSERLMLVLPKHHRLAGEDRIFWTDLRNEVFVVPAGGNGPAISTRLNMQFALHGFRANLVVQEASPECIVSMVALGRFITIVTDAALGAVWPEIGFHEIHEAGGPARLEFALHWRGDNSNAALKRFFGVVGERFPEVAMAETAAS